jgi:hypothetical protein
MQDECMTSAHAVHAFLLHLPFGGGSSNTHIQYAAVYMLLLVLGTAVLLPLLASMASTFFLAAAIRSAGHVQATGQV